MFLNVKQRKQLFFLLFLKRAFSVILHLSMKVRWRIVVTLFPSHAQFTFNWTDMISRCKLWPLQLLSTRPPFPVCFFAEPQHLRLTCFVWTVIKNVVWMSTRVNTYFQQRCLQSHTLSTTETHVGWGGNEIHSEWTLFVKIGWATLFIYLPFLLL